MRTGETAQEMCERHVTEQEHRILRQEALVERLRQIRAPLLDDALRLLDDMHEILAEMRAHAARLTPAG
jgi:hypothetical protein